jgi:hypothetical protein
MPGERLSASRADLRRALGPVSNRPVIVLEGQRFLRWRMLARRWCFERGEKCVWMTVAVYAVAMLVVAGVVLLRYGAEYEQQVEGSCLDVLYRLEGGFFREQCLIRRETMADCRRIYEEQLKVCHE